MTADEWAEGDRAVARTFVGTTLITVLNIGVGYAAIFKFGADRRFLQNAGTSAHSAEKHNFVQTSLSTLHNTLCFPRIIDVWLV